MDNTTGLAINVSLKDIYDQLCTECQERILELLAHKAQAQGLKEALRSQLSPSPSSGSSPPS